MVHGGAVVMSGLRTGYVVREDTGHIIACDLTLEQALAIANRDKYSLTVHWCPDVVQTRYARTNSQKP